MGFRSKIIYAVVTPTPQEKTDNNSTKKHERNKERNKQNWLLWFVGWPPATWQTISFWFLPHKCNSLIAVTLGLNKICIFLFYYLSYMRVCMFTSPPAPLKEGKTIRHVQWNQNTELKGPEMLHGAEKKRNNYLWVYQQHAERIQTTTRFTT